MRTKHRRAAWYCEAMPEAPLENQLIGAIRYLRPKANAAAAAT